MKKYLILVCLLWVYCSCSSSDDAVGMTADFAFAPKSENPNTFLFQAEVSGDYQLLEWVFPGETVKNRLETEHNFAKKGAYEVTLNLWKDGECVGKTRTVTVAQDDPGYEGPKLIWSDEFDGNSLDNAVWSVETDIRVNNELQKYVDEDNYVVANGFLTITAQKVNDDKQFGSYTSARLITAGKKEFKYGRMEIRAKLPKGLGIWPAIWMLGADVNQGIDWPACGEIDIMEYVGYRPGVVQASLHCPDRNGGNSITNTLDLPTEDEFHVYGLHWTEDKIECYVDDRTQPYFTYDKPASATPGNWAFDRNFFFILNVAVGGDWGGQQGVDNGIFPASMVVDYVRVYEND